MRRLAGGRYGSLGRAALVTIATLAAFGLSLTADFVWDDWLLLVPNPVYWEFDLPGMFLASANGLEYLPVRDLTLALDAAIWGKRPFGFHLTNLLIYLLSLPAAHAAIHLLARLAREPRPGVIAFWGTLVFALHPLHAEAVNFVAARNTLLATLFMLLTFTAFNSALLRGSVVRLLWAATLFALALLSKASAVFFPLFLVFTCLLFPQVRRRRRMVVGGLAALLVLDAAGVALHAALAADSGIVTRDVLRFGNESVVATGIKALQIPVFYLKLMLWPASLSAVYPDDFLAGAAAARAAGAAAVLGGLILGAWMLRRRTLLPLAALGWFLLSLGPVLNLVPSSPVVADRYAYPAVLSLGLILGWLLSRADAWHRHAAVAGIVILTAWLALDINRSLAWRSDLDLWQAASAVYPDDARMHLAYTHWNAGRYRAAVEELGRARPPGYHYYFLGGRLAAMEGRPGEAEALLTRALAAGGDTERAVHLEMALTLEKLGQRDRALDHYLAAARAPSLDPRGLLEARAEEGAARLRAQRAGQRAALQRAVAEAPHAFEPSFRLGTFLHTEGAYAEAERAYLQATAAAPGRWEAWFNLGLVRARLGDHAGAIEAFGETLERRPGFVRALNQAGIAHVARREYDAAESRYLEALAVDPDFLKAAFNLGRLYFLTGRREESLHYYTMARRLAAGNTALVTQIDHAIGRLP